MRLSEALIQKFAAHDDPSFFIAAYPNKETKKKIKKYQEDMDSKGATETTPPDEYHNTIRFVKRKDWKDGKDEELAKALDNITDKLKEIGNITCKPTAIENLGDKDALVIKLESDEMDKAFDCIDSAMRAVGCPPSQYPKYIQHMTLFYDVKAEGKEKPDFDLVFDEIVLQDNEEKVLWKVKL